MISVITCSVDVVIEHTHTHTRTHTLRRRTSYVRYMTQRGMLHCTASKSQNETTTSQHCRPTTQYITVSMQCPASMYDNVRRRTLPYIAARWRTAIYMYVHVWACRMRRCTASYAVWTGRNTSMLARSGYYSLNSKHCIFTSKNIKLTRRL